jgi:ATP-dependent exoDNAse (exonuclease V) beta subunit
LAKRLESPSSINTFKQCKRKYYYQYVEKLPTGSSIHLVRGNIAHSVLEDFYDIDLSEISEDNYANKFKVIVQKLLLHHWKKEKERLDTLGLSKDKLCFYFEETMVMIMNWVNQFITEFTKEFKDKNMSLQEAFSSLTPVREQEYRSDNYSVRGFIDAIQHVEDQVHIIDYKTNARFDIKDSIKLQLAIYSLLYFEKHGKTPSKLGIYFLRHKLKFIDFDEELINLAKREIELIHAHTSITERISDYHRTITPLCKWRTGQCDFYETCCPHG